MPRIVLARHAGACYGVERALSLVYEALEGDPAPVHTLGPLIHNPQVVEQLEAAGAKVAGDLQQAQSGTLVIRSHGVRPEIVEQAKAKGLCVVDATCPHVSNAQDAARELHNNDHLVIVVGEIGHPEVEAICACAADEAIVVQTPADLPPDLAQRKKPIGVVVQTTQSAAALDSVIAELAARGIKADVRSTICFATQQRQEAALELACNADAMIVVGGRNSGNTTRLFEICKSVCPNTHHIETAAEIDNSWFSGVETIGISAGASTPESQINSVVTYLKNIGQPSVLPALIAAVAEESAAYRHGIRAGMHLLTVDGQPLTDYIDWLWLSTDATIELELVELGLIELTRTGGESWGLEFASPVFDAVKTCKNNCLFCFMAMLPEGLRSALYLRDDDYRLSFLQGNFVTLTNVSVAEIQRIVDLRLSPLHVSLHAVDADVRLRLMGANQQRGLVVLDELLSQGIEIHTQVVLLPGLNDGAVLGRTLDWIARRPGITVCGIVPYGYTQFAELKQGFSGAGCRAVIEAVAGWQQDNPGVVVQLADEFFVKAWPENTLEHLPADGYYVDYPMLYDGIGMLRGFVDEWVENLADGLQGSHADRWQRSLADGLLSGGPGRGGSSTQTYSAQSTTGVSDTTRRLRNSFPTPSPETANDMAASSVLIITGGAFAGVLAQLIGAAGITGVSVLAIENRFFGGNVDVAGLLCAADIIEQTTQHLQAQTEGGSPGSDPTAILIPSVIFNDDGLTLDDKRLSDIQGVLERLAARVVMVDCQAVELIAAIKQYSNI